jgi:hypothetical protein
MQLSEKNKIVIASGDLFWNLGLGTAIYGLRRIHKHDFHDGC